jgi:hypothetical protein
MQRDHPLEKYPEIYLIAKELVRACAERKVCLTGFIFTADPPVLAYIGTVKERGPDLTALHLKLCDTADDQGQPHVTENVPR